jgi:hypothetical protein
MRKDIIDTEKKSRAEFIKISRDKARDSFFEHFKPLQQRFIDTKKERKRIGHDTDSEDEELYERSVIIDYY